MNFGAHRLPFLLGFLIAGALAEPPLEENREAVGGGAAAARAGRRSPSHSHLSPGTAAASLQQGSSSSGGSSGSSSRGHQGQQDRAPAALVRREMGVTVGGHPYVVSPNISMDSMMNEVIQSSPAAIDLDGVWTTASGMNITITGSDVAGQPGSGYKEVITVSNGGRRVQMHVPEEDLEYWAVLSGRGSLDWNDGDVWSRAIDCSWQPWAIFGACGGPCPEGHQQRRRDFEYLQENGGEPCAGPKEECREAKFCSSNYSRPASTSLLEDPVPAAGGNSSVDNSSNSSNKSGAATITVQASVMAFSALLVVAAST